MRLLTMLATAVLLAACVHDTEGYNLFLAESGVSLTYYIGSEGDAGQKDFDDPWGTIKEVFDVDTVHPQKSQDDPWETILEKFSPETSHTGKRRDEDPWGSIQDSFGAETVHTGKVNDHYYAGVEKSRAVFLAYSYRMPTTFRAEVTEVRGRVAKLKFADGVEQYVIDAPANWKEGTQLETGFVAALTKKDRPFLGVRFWRTVQGAPIGELFSNERSGGSVGLGTRFSAAGSGLFARIEEDISPMGSAFWMVDRTLSALPKAY